LTSTRIAHVSLLLCLRELGVDLPRGRVNEKHVQWAIYLAQRGGVDLGYRFKWYSSGPLCPELTSDLYEMISDLEMMYEGMKRERRMIRWRNRRRPRKEVKMSLSERIRPGSEAAPWVVEEVKRMDEELERLKEALRREREQVVRVQDERAASFARLQRAVGGCTLGEYQPEADLEIESRILALRQELEDLKRV
jgi:uncharacterized protein YwgA